MKIAFSLKSNQPFNHVEIFSIAYMSLIYKFTM
jgi:hypothetical protein